MQDVADACISIPEIWVDSADKYTLGLGWVYQILPPLIFSIASKHGSPIAYYGQIWLLSPQHSCGEIWQIWSWPVRFNLHLAKLQIVMCLDKITHL